jgi:hypothetical protein
MLTGFQSTGPFEAIANQLRSIGLWCFPIAFRRNGDHYDKKPTVKWKHLQDRPPTDLELKNWIAKFRNAGGGLPTGPGTGVLIIEGDCPEAIEYLEKRGMPETWLVRTRRGLHYYFRYPLDFPVHNSASEIAAAVHVRGLGGFVVAAGSQYWVPNADNCLVLFRYEYEQGHSPCDLPLAELPHWLNDELRDRQRARGTVVEPPVAPQPYRGKVRAWARKAYDANLELASAAAPGRRNDTLFHVARRLGQFCAPGELEEAIVFGAIYAIADRWPNSAHTRGTIQRAFAYGKLSPKSAPIARDPQSVELTGEETPGSDLLDDNFWSGSLGQQTIDGSLWD